MKVRTGLLVPKRLNWVSALWRLKFPVRQWESLPLPRGLLTLTLTVCRVTFCILWWWMVRTIGNEADETLAGVNKDGQLCLWLTHPIASLLNSQPFEAQELLCSDGGVGGIRVPETEEGLPLAHPSLLNQPPSSWLPLNQAVVTVLCRQSWHKLQLNWPFSSVGLPRAQSERAEVPVWLRFTEPC